MLRKKSLLALLLFLCMVVEYCRRQCLLRGNMCRKIPAGRDTETR